MFTIKRQSCVNIVYAVKKMEKIQIIRQRNSFIILRGLSLIPETKNKTKYKFPYSKS